MAIRKFFSAFLLLLFIMSAGAGCGSGGSTTTSLLPASSPSGGGGSGTGGGGTGGGTTLGTATLVWSAPTTNTDGTPLTDLAGYKVHYGTTHGSYSNTITVGNVTSYSINNLASGTYYFSLTSYDTSGVESGYSNEVSKVIQ